MTANLPDARHFAAAVQQMLEDAGGTFEFHTEPTAHDKELLPIVEPSNRPGYLRMRLVPIAELPPELAVELAEMIIAQLGQQRLGKTNSFARDRLGRRSDEYVESMFLNGDPYRSNYSGGPERRYRPGIRYVSDEPAPPVESKTEAPHLVGGNREIDVEPKRLT